MSDRILSLCADCTELMKNAYSVKPVTKATTEIKTHCERCGKKRDRAVMRQVLVTKK